MEKLLNRIFGPHSKTVGYYFQRFIDNPKLKYNSKRNYKTIYKAYIKIYEDLDVRKIDNAFAVKFLRGLNKLQINSITEVKNVFSAILKEAVKDKIIDKNVFANIKIKRTPPVTKPTPYTKEEIKILMEAAKKEEWFVNFLAFLLLTGARIGEILALHWENIKEDKIIISKTINCGVIGRTKNQIVREIPIFNALKPYIEAQRVYSQEGRVFPYVNGSTGVFYRWSRIRKACNMEGRKLSNTRHTFIKAAIESGMKIEYLSLLTGHKNPDVPLKFYLRFLDPNRYSPDFTTF